MGGAAGAIGAIGSIAGGLGGGGGGGGGGGEEGFAIVDEFENEAQGYLENALRAAIPYTESFTYQAIDVQREMLKRQLDMLEYARKTSREDIKEYYERAQAMTAPYREAGYNAFDQLQDTLGMARPESGSSAMYHAMENKAKERSAQNRMGIEAARTAEKLGMDPDSAYKYMQQAVHGGNLLGLKQGLKEWAVSNYKEPDAKKVYGSPVTARAGEDGEAGENPWADVISGSRSSLEDFINRTPPPSSDSIIADFMRTGLPINRDFMNARNSLTSSQRSLAQLGNTGYGNTTPRLTDVK